MEFIHKAHIVSASHVGTLRKIIGLEMDLHRDEVFSNTYISFPRRKKLCLHAEVSTYFYKSYLSINHSLQCIDFCALAPTDWGILQHLIP